MEVQRVGEENVSGVLFEFFNDRESDGNKCFGENTRPVVFWRIDPAVEEVMVSVRQSLHLSKVLNCCCFVELFSHFITERQMSHIEVAVLGKLDPVLEQGSLDSLHWPIPGILTLHNIELALHSECHDGVTGMRASSIHYHWVQTIETEHSEVITGLDQVFVNNNFLGLSFLEVPVDAPLQEFFIGLFHILRDLCLEKRNP